MKNIQNTLLIETALDIKLPADYKGIITNYPSKLLEIDAYDYLLIGNVEKIIDENLQAREKFYGRPLDKKAFIIGENGCGDYYLILLTENSPVYSFFHDNNKFYKVADNLGYYIEKIITDQVEENWGKIEFESRDLGRAPWKFW